MLLDDFTRRWCIAITGGIATGKSTLARLLRERSFLVIDADQLSREILAAGSEGLKAVAAHFGRHLILPNGQLDRAQMRLLIAHDAQRRAELEAIVHPRLAAATLKAIDAAGLLAAPRLFFYEAALIFERERAADFREVWVTDCPENLQIERLMARDRCSRAAALAIIAAQAPQAEKVRRASRVFNTEASWDELALCLDAALLALAPQPHRSP